MKKFIHRFLETGVRARPARSLGVGSGGGFTVVAKGSGRGRGGTVRRAEAWQVQVTLGRGSRGCPGHLVPAWVMRAQSSQCLRECGSRGEGVGVGSGSVGLPWEGQVLGQVSVAANGWPTLGWALMPGHRGHGR